MSLKISSAMLAVVMTLMLVRSSTSALTRAQTQCNYYQLPPESASGCQMVPGNSLFPQR